MIKLKDKYKTINKKGDINEKKFQEDFYDHIDIVTIDIRH